MNRYTFGVYDINGNALKISIYHTSIEKARYMAHQILTTRKALSLLDADSEIWLDKIEADV